MAFPQFYLTLFHTKHLQRTLQTWEWFVFVFLPPTPSSSFSSLSNLLCAKAASLDGKLEVGLDGADILLPPLSFFPGVPWGNDCTVGHPTPPHYHSPENTEGSFGKILFPDFCTMVWEEREERRREGGGGNFHDRLCWYLTKVGLVFHCFRVFRLNKPCFSFPDSS